MSLESSTVPMILAPAAFGCLEEKKKKQEAIPASICHCSGLPTEISEQLRHHRKCHKQLCHGQINVLKT